MYEEFARYADQMTVAGMDRVIAAGAAWTMNLLTSATMVGVMVAGVLCWFGKLDFWWVVRRVFIILVVVLLLQVDQYATYIRTPFWETIPNGIASALAGGEVAITPAQRFDKMNDAAAAAVARVDRRVTSMWEIRAQVSIALAQGAMNVFIGLCFILWQISRIAIALLIQVGPFLMIAAVFDATRHFIISWFGKLVSLSVWSLCAMALTEIVLQGSMLWIRRTAEANVGVAEAVDGLWKIAVWLLLCTTVMIGLPYYASIGGAASSGITAGMGMAMGAARMGGGAAMGAANLAAKMGTKAGSAAGRQINKMMAARASKSKP